MQLQENTLFASRYQLIKLLGRGGFSEVWLAKDNWTHLKIALKVYAPGTGMDANGLQEFCGELASVYDLNHTNLLKPQHVDTWENMPYLIMAYCSQGSCGSKLGKMSETEMWKFIHDVAAGLAYLHSKDVVHQDIKPDNILIDDAGNYLITDFGVSTRARSTLRKSVVASSAGGTTAYMGPERFSRQPAPTKASDIWSFGAMCFELLEGVVPFGEIGGGMQKGGAEIPAITADVSDALKYTITKMLQKETWDRPTAATLVEWATNPDAIEVDHSLLEETEPVATPSVDPTDSDRSTQRLGQPLPSTSSTTASAHSTQRVVTLPTHPKPIVTTPSTPDLQKNLTKAWIWCIVVIVLVALAIALIAQWQDEVRAEQAHQERIRQERLAEEKRQKEIEEDRKNTTLSVSPSWISVDGDGDYKNVTITSNRDWSVSGSSSWILCTIDGKKINISCDYNPTRSTRDGFVDIRTANGAKTQRITLRQNAGSSTKPPTAYIQKIWANHNVTQNGQLGMKIHVHFSVSYKFNQNVTVYAFFKYRDGEILKDFDKKYASAGYVFVEQQVTPNYVHCEWKDLQIFMPYEQLDFVKGSLNNEPLRLDLGIWDDSKGKLIGDMKVFNFNVTY